MFTNSIKQARQIRKFHVPVVHQWLGNNKKVCCTCKFVVSHNKPIALLLFSFLLRSLLELPVVAIQKFCYHGNVTSYFSSLVSTDYFQQLYIVLHTTSTTFPWRTMSSKYMYYEFWGCKIYVLDEHNYYGCFTEPVEGISWIVQKYLE